VLRIYVKFDSDQMSPLFVSKTVHKLPNPVQTFGPILKVNSVPNPTRPAPILHGKNLKLNNENNNKTLLHVEPYPTERATVLCLLCGFK
jgi:hypothetical protein